MKSLQKWLQPHSEVTLFVSFVLLVFKCTQWCMTLISPTAMADPGFPRGDLLFDRFFSENWIKVKNYWSGASTVAPPPRSVIATLRSGSWSHYKVDCWNGFMHWFQCIFSHFLMTSVHFLSKSYYTWYLFIGSSEKNLRSVEDRSFRVHAWS